METLADAHEFGRGVARDPIKAREWFVKSAASDWPAGARRAGRVYQLGIGGDRDYARARTFYLQAWDLGDVGAAYLLGEVHYYGRGVAASHQLAAAWYRKAADLGHAKAAFSIGYLYEYGEGLPRDAAEARRWYEVALRLGDEETAFRLGLLYENGTGVERTLLRRCASSSGAAMPMTDARWAGSAGSTSTELPSPRISRQQPPGIASPPISDWPGRSNDWVIFIRKVAELQQTCGKQRSGTPKPRPPATLGRKLSWLGSTTSARPAKRTTSRPMNSIRPRRLPGSAYAHRRLGDQYYYGRGVDRDFRKSFEWYAKAAKLNDNDAMGSLGYLYEHGEGVPKDNAKAREWYAKAAELSLVSSMRRLADIHQDYREYDKAAEWYCQGRHRRRCRVAKPSRIAVRGGKGVERDEQRALALLSKAAEQGDANAMEQLADSYEAGRTIPRDFLKAATLHRRAAERRATGKLESFGVFDGKTARAYQRAAAGGQLSNPRAFGLIEDRQLER